MQTYVYIVYVCGSRALIVRRGGVRAVIRAITHIYIYIRVHVVEVIHICMRVHVDEIICACAASWLKLGEVGEVGELGELGRN